MSVNKILPVTSVLYCLGGGSWEREGERGQ